MDGVSAYILAGGKSTRMGSDKGLLPLNESFFAALIVTALKKASIEKITVVSANKAYDVLNCNRIEDIYPDKGPVGGVYTALSHSKTVHNIILSVDVPLVSAEIINWLIANIALNKQLTQVKVLNKPNPLIAVYHKGAASVFKEHLLKNQLKLRTVVDEIPHQTIEVPEAWAALLQNINTKEDYKSLLA
ncbi:MAG TPA: molybdenum cofactor guanylyltransferase [Pelobium sp.]